MFIASCKGQMDLDLNNSIRAQRSAGNFALIETCKPINSINFEVEYKRAFHKYSIFFWKLAKKILKMSLLKKTFKCIRKAAI